MRDSDRHGEGGRMSVTEQDRERARGITCQFPTRIDPVEAIAAALADERDRARAPFLALAEEWRRIADDYFAAGHRDKGYDALEHAAELRRAAEDPQ
jgi:hypothetical protein